MRLENLYPNFATLSEAEQAAYIASYRLRRAEDMAKPSTFHKKAADKGSKVDLSEDQKAIMKLLGIKQKDILALQASIGVEEEDENDEVLLTETSIDEEEE